MPLFAAVAAGLGTVCEPTARYTQQATYAQQFPQSNKTSVPNQHQSQSKKIKAQLDTP